MKTLLTIFFLFFSSHSLKATAETLLLDIYTNLNIFGYKIISVNTVNQNDILYVLQNSKNLLVHCIYTIDGNMIACFDVKKEKN